MHKPNPELSSSHFQQVPSNLNKYFSLQEPKEVPYLNLWFHTGLPGGVVSNTRVADAISQSPTVKMQLHCPRSSISGPNMIVHIPKLVLYSMENLKYNRENMSYMQNSLLSGNMAKLPCTLNLFLLLKVTFNNELLKSVNIVLTVNDHILWWKITDKNCRKFVRIL